MNLKISWQQNICLISFSHKLLRYCYLNFCFINNKSQPQHQDQKASVISFHAVSPTPSPFQTSLQHATSALSPKDHWPHLQIFSLECQVIQSLWTFPFRHECHPDLAIAHSASSKDFLEYVSSRWNPHHSTLNHFTMCNPVTFGGDTTLSTTASIKFQNIATAPRETPFSPLLLCCT